MSDKQWICLAVNVIYCSLLYEEGLITAKYCFGNIYYMYFDNI